MPTALEAVDAQHPDLMAAVHGPLALFAVGTVPEKVSKQQLLAATQASQGSTNWIMKTASSNVTLRPFTAIQDDHYRLYHKVDA
jgi:hypothetical protein